MDLKNKRAIQNIKKDTVKGKNVNDYINYFLSSDNLIFPQGPQWS